MPHCRGPRAPALLIRARTVLAGLVAVALTACGGGGGIGDNDGTFVGRTGVVITGIADDGTATSPLAGATCRAVTEEGVELNRDTTGADGSFLLLVDPGRRALVECAAAGSQLRLRRIVSTEGAPEGGQLDGQDVLPATTVVTRIVLQEAADDATLDITARFAALLAPLVPFDAAATTGDGDLQLLADVFTLAFDRLRDAGVDLPTEALIADLYDDGDLDAALVPALPAEALDALNGELAGRAAAAGRAVPDAVLATHPTLRLTVVNAGGGATRLFAAPRFGTLLREARTAAQGEGGVLVVSAGDQIASRLEIIPSFEDASLFYDADVLDVLGYDVVGVGPQDLELGPAVAGAFYEEIDGDTNVVFSDVALANEAAFANLVNGQRLFGNLVADVRSRSVAFVSYSGRQLNRRASLRRLGQLEEDAQITTVQDAIDRARAQGARFVVLLAGTTDADDLAAAVARFDGIDLVVTIPSAVADPAATDPVAPPFLVLEDTSIVPVLETFSEYSGFRSLRMDVDPLGRVDVSSLVLSRRVVAAEDPAEDAELVAAVVTPLRGDLDELATERAAEVRVALDGRAASVRAGETNFGNLLADSAVATGRSQANLFQSTAPRAALVDAGAFVADSEVPTGELFRAEVFGLLREGALYSVLQAVPPEALERMFEFSAANLGNGLFAQVGGLQVTLDPDGVAQVLDADGAVVTPGSRVVSVRIAGGDFLVRDGAAVEGAAALSVVVSDAIVAAYPIGDLDLVGIGITVGQGLDAFLRVSLDRTVRDDDYPVGGEGRITIGGDN